MVYAMCKYTALHSALEGYKKSDDYLVSKWSFDHKKELQWNRNTHFTSETHFLSFHFYL